MALGGHRGPQLVNPHVPGESRCQMDIASSLIRQNQSRWHCVHNLQKQHHPRQAHSRATSAVAVPRKIKPAMTAIGYATGQI